MLDEATTKRFVVTTRNLASVELQAWPVQGGGEDFEKALSRVRARTLPDEAPPLRIPVTIAASRDRSVDTAVDLSSKLAAGTRLHGGAAAGRARVRGRADGLPEHSEATSPGGAARPRELEGARGARAGAPRATLVHVARLGSGEAGGGRHGALRQRRGRARGDDRREQGRRGWARRATPRCCSSTPPTPI